jgi:hydroxyacylglutathione hydrolase
MLLRRIYDETLAQAAYLIGCQRAGEAILIDPQRDIDRYRAIAAANSLRIAAVAETHIHADFLAGTRELAEQVGARVYVSGEGPPDWQYRWLDRRDGGGAYPHVRFRDGDVFSVGSVELRVVHTPGHTPEHISFLITDRGGGASEPMGMVTGDFVFVGDVGRPDLLETAVGRAGEKEPAARSLCQSVLDFLELPDYVQVWPAHGAGSACGKALGAVPQTTVGYERRFNPAVRRALEGEAGFVAYILAGQPEPPLYFARMKQENRDGPKLLGQLPQPERMSIDAFVGLDSRQVAIVDTREWPEFRLGHVAGSLFAPLGTSFATEAGSYIAPTEPICLVVDARGLEQAVRCLVRVGLDHVAGWIPADEVRSWALTARGAARIEELDAPAVQEGMKAGAFFPLDVRRAAEFAEGHVSGARNIAHTRLAAHVEELPRDRTILVNCHSGARSARACALLERSGRKAVNLKGGILAWAACGAAVTR